jgi:hypothetical protein
MDPSRDREVIRCPRLGSTVSFQYCRTIGDDALPCAKTADCWWERFDIAGFLKDNLTPEQYQTFSRRSAQPQPKVAGLVALIEQARKRNLQ